MFSLDEGELRIKKESSIIKNRRVFRGRKAVDIVYLFITLVPRAGLEPAQRDSHVILKWELRVN